MKEDKIEVGEYCKLKNGRIGKIVNENIDAYLFDIPIYEDQQGIRQFCLDKEFKDFIVKHSKYIMDLIEVRRYSTYKRCIRRRLLLDV